MHNKNIGLHSQSARKEGANRTRITLTLSDQTKTLLRKLGNGSMSDGVYLSVAVVTQLLRQKVIKIDFDKGGVVYRLGNDELVSSPQSGCDEARQLHRAKVDSLFPKSERNPYAGEVMGKRRLMETGHFTHRMMRAILPDQRVTDRSGYWWIRVDNPDKPIHEQRGMRNNSGRLMATYIGLESEWDNWEKYSHQIGQM